MGGSVATKDKGGTDAMGTKSGSNGFVIRGFYGGRNLVVRKSSSNFESSVVQTDSA